MVGVTCAVGVQLSALTTSTVIEVETRAVEHAWWALLREAFLDAAQHAGIISPRPSPLPYGGQFPTSRPALTIFGSMGAASLCRLMYGECGNANRYQ